MRLRCEVCGGCDFVKVDGSYRCEGCGMRYDIGGLKALMGEGRDEEEVPLTASGGHEPAYGSDEWPAGRETAGDGDDARHAGDAGERGHGHVAGQYVPQGSPEVHVRKRPLDALPTSVLLLIGVAVFGLCFLVYRSSFGLRVLGMSTQEWLLISYTALLIATLEGRDSKVLGVVTTACAILTIVVLSLQVWTWTKDGSFCLLRLPGTETGVIREVESENRGDDGAHEATLGDLGAFEAWTVSGKGDDAVGIDCRPSPCLIDVTYTGEGGFILVARDADGREMDLLVDATGPYEGQVTTYGCEEDAATLEVRAEGAWELRFAPMDAVERVDFAKLGTSEVFHGDRVVYVDDDSQGSLGFVYRSEGNFTVKAVTKTGSELLVDTTGPYEGTVALSGPGAFLVVSADGDWSMSSS